MTPSPPTEKMNLGPFLRELQSRLERLKPDQIRQNILRHARELPPSRRRSYLEIFPDINLDNAYSDLLRSTLSRRPPDESKREDYSEAAASIARERMRAIVSNQYRKAYHRAASVMVGLAEVRALSGQPEDGIAVVRGAREKFPRHSAFRRELNALIASSPVLPDVEV